MHHHVLAIPYTPLRHILFFILPFFHQIGIKKGDHFYMCATAWQQYYDVWPIPGDIQRQYFQGIVLSTSKQGRKDWYKIQWESDQKTASVYNDFFTDVYWDLPLEGLLIDKETWTKYTSVISITLNAPGMYIVT